MQQQRQFQTTFAEVEVLLKVQELDKGKGQQLSLESHIAVVAGPSTSHTEEENLENREVDKASDVEDEHFNSKMDCGSLVLPRLPTAKHFTTGTNQWVVVKFSTKKSIKQFIGRVRKVMSCNKLEGGFLKMTGKDSCICMARS